MADRVRAAMLGAGQWAGVLAAASSGCGALELRWCWARDPDKLQGFAARHRLQARGDLESLLADPALDAVVIALPNSEHGRFAELAARRGKHVFIEKPIAGTLAEGLGVAAIERRHGVHVAVGHCARFLGGNRAIRRMIDAGELGQLTQIEAVFGNSRGLRLQPTDWRWYQAGAPGGPLSQIGIHQFDVLEALGGPIRAVSARCAHHSPLPSEVEDQWMVIVEFVDGKLGSLAVNWTSPGRYSVRATGMLGSVVHEIDQTLWSDASRLHENASLRLERAGAGSAGCNEHAVEPGNMFTEELDHFAGVVLGRHANAITADAACRALAAVEASIESARRRGAAIELDAVIRSARLAAEARPESPSGLIP